MAVRIATPYSHLFAEQPVRRALTAASDLLELRTPEQAAEVDGPVLYHCELSLVAPWSDAQRGELGALARAARERLLALSFHVLSRYIDNRVVDGAFVGQGEPSSEEALLGQARDNVAEVRRLFGEDIVILVENNNHLGTDAYDVVTEALFLRSLMTQTGTRLLWDVAHSRITAHNTGQDEADYLCALGVDDCVQVHLSGHGLKDGLAFDAHEPLGEDDWQFFSKQLPALSQLQFVTVEFYKSSGVLLEQIQRLRTELGGR